MYRQESTINRQTGLQLFSVMRKAKTCSLWFEELWLESADAKPWGRSPSRWTPCWTGRAARGFSPMSPACRSKERAEFSVTRGSHSRATTLKCRHTKKKIGTTQAHLISTEAYSRHMKWCRYRRCIYTVCAQWSSTLTTSLSTTQKVHPTHKHTKKPTSHFPGESLPTQALCFLSPIA